MSDQSTPPTHDQPQPEDDAINALETHFRELLARMRTAIRYQCQGGCPTDPGRDEFDLDKLADIFTELILEQERAANYCHTLATVLIDAGIISSVAYGERVLANLERRLATQEKAIGDKLGGSVTCNPDGSIAYRQGQNGTPPTTPD